MTLDEQISDLRIRVKDRNAEQFTDGILTEWLNQGYRDLTARLPSEILEDVTTSKDIPISVAGGAKYDLPASFTQYITALYDGYQCSPLTQNERTLLTENSFYSAATIDPFCILWENDIELFPTPTGNATLTLYYIAKPVDMSSGTDEPNLPAFTHATIVLYACARAAQQQGNTNEAMVFMQEYETKIQEIRYLYTPTVEAGGDMRRRQPKLPFRPRREE